MDHDFETQDFPSFQGTISKPVQSVLGAMKGLQWRRLAVGRIDHTPSTLGERLE